MCKTTSFGTISEINMPILRFGKAAKLNLLGTFVTILMKRKHFIVIFTLAVAFLFAGHAHGQSYNVLRNKNYQIEARAHYGFFLQFHHELERYKAHFPSYEFSIYRTTFGKKRWERLYNFPLIGLTFYQSDLGIFDELGKVFALYPFINFPLNQDSDRQITFKLGVGVGYLTNKFHNIENYHNFAIGSLFNAAINLSFEYRQKLSNRFYLNSSLGLTHFSNGSTKTPNFGINIVSAATGFSFFIRKPNPTIISKLNPKLYLFEFDDKKWMTFDGNFAVWMKDITNESEFGTHNFNMVYDFNVNILAQLSMKDRAGIGFELVQDRSDFVFLQKRNHQNDTIVNYTDFDILKLGVGPTYEMVMDRMSFLFHIGWHLTGSDQHEGSFYQKLAVRYDIYDNFYFSFGFTTHYIRADYLGIGFGYRFHQKYYLRKS